jgi:hypothetical protein
MPPSSLRRAFLWSFLGFLGVTALIAIAVVVGGEFNDTMARVLGTTGSVSAGSVLAMACAAFRERERLAGTIGIALAAVASVMLVALLWRDRVDEDQGRATLLAVIYAVSMAHAELMLLGRYEDAAKRAAEAADANPDVPFLDLMHVTAGATAHLLEDHLRLGGGYVLRMERGGESLPNDTVRLWGQVKF